MLIMKMATLRANAFEIQFEFHVVEWYCDVEVKAQVQNAIPPVRIAVSSGEETGI